MHNYVTISDDLSCFSSVDTGWWIATSRLLWHKCWEVHLVDYMWYLMKWLIHVRNWFLSTCNGNLFGPYTLPFCVPIWMECDVTLAQEHCLMGATFSHQWKNPHRAGYKEKKKKRTRISWKVISFLSLLTIFINVSDYHNGYETKNNENRSCLTNCLKMKKPKKLTPLHNKLHQTS